ncbi:MAG TPA: CBS domain-containing protein [Candidatus Acidoferrales bacterium]|nr:CBS domain-containing protein [Candidatus Acidoferrales bacterium]
MAAEPGRAKISTLMSRRLVAVHPNTTIEVAIKLLKSTNVGLLPVVKEGRLVGIIDDKLLLKYETERNFSMTDSVEGIMKKPMFVEMDSSVDFSVKYVIEHGLTRLPVVNSDSDMKCVGVVSATELLSAKSA